MTLSTDLILGLMSLVEREAGELILHARKIISKNKTDSRNVVTEYDIKVQNLLMERFSERISSARFVCEENEIHDNLKAEHLFIIDPIDGTMNFTKNLNHSCISVAYSSFGEIKAAVVYNPFVDEMFTAVKGEGARLNGEKICADQCSLKDGLVLFGTAPYNSNAWDETFALAKTAFLNSLDIRRQGSAELDLCSVAAGRAGIYFEESVSLWDYAAGYLIATEAGAEVTRLDGTPLPFDLSRCSILAGGKKARDEFLELSVK